MLNFSSSDYLPRSQERVEHLRKIIDRRPVAILAAGPSINELERKVKELRRADICYFGLNAFLVYETHILRQIGKRTSVIMCSSREGIPGEIDSINDFLDRKDDNLFISSFWRGTFGLMPPNFNLKEFLTKYDKKLIFFSVDKKRIVPNKEKPLHFIEGNSLTVLVQMAIIGGASKIVIFGADGYCWGSAEKQYYRPGEYNIDNRTLARENLMRDTNKYFNPVVPIAIRNVYKTYNILPIDIINCSPRSFYTAFPIVSYEDTFRFLFGGKRFNHTTDQRTLVQKFVNEILYTVSLAQAAF